MSTSTADRPSAYRPATLGPDGVFHGTHFRLTLPAGWETGNTSSNDPHVEVAIKQGPLNQPNPVIVVTVGDSPSPTLPVEAYADTLRNRDLSDNSVSPVGGIQATTLAGQLAESYTYTEKSPGGNTFRIIVALRGGVSYTIEFAAPHDRFGTASSGPLRSFLSSWQWDLPTGQKAGLISWLHYGAPPDRVRPLAARKRASAAAGIYTEAPSGATVEALRKLGE